MRIERLASYGRERTLIRVSGWTPSIHRDAMLILGVLCGLAQATGVLALPIDAVAYWEAGQSQNLYPEHWSEVATGYLFYPPPVAQVMTFLQPIGWPVFVTILTTAIFASMWYCAGRWSWVLLALGLPFLLFKIGPQVAATFLGYALMGNLQWILAALTIVALRHPSVWSIQLVTKVTSAIGWWWHPLRGEWRAAAIGAAASTAILAISFALSPALWYEFIDFVGRNGTMSDPPLEAFFVPFGIRLATAAPLVVWGARTNRPWTVPVACGWSLPALYGLGFLVFWVAATRLVERPPSLDLSRFEVGRRWREARLRG